MIDLLWNDYLVFIIILELMLINKVLRGVIIFIIHSQIPYARFDIQTYFNVKVIHEPLWYLNKLPDNFTIECL